MYEVEILISDTITVQGNKSAASMEFPQPYLRVCSEM